MKHIHSSHPVTSAWPPGFRVLLQRSHFRQNLCQSFPKDDTFSAVGQEETKIVLSYIVLLVYET